MAGISFHAVEWDDGNRSKCLKHGMGIPEIEHVLKHTETLVVPARPGDEPRFIAVGRVPSGRFALVVFTLRSGKAGATVRPISARFMHAKELEGYGKAIAGFQKR